jgi:hypothetical protein
VVAAAHRLITLLAILGAAGLLVLTWSKVVATLANIKPIEPPKSHVSSIVWADRVFENPAALRRWLRGRGQSYEAWSTHHPRQAAIIEHRPVPAQAAAAPKPKKRAASRITAAWPQTASTAHRDAVIRDAAFAVLLVLALVLAAAAALPAPLRRRYPALAFRVAHHRGAFGAGAAAIVLGLAVSVGLS